MVVISEISDGDDPNKKPKELEKKPKQVQKKLKEKVLYSLPIPNALIVSCFARVSRCHYPTLSLVSSPFYQLIASPELYCERSNIGHTECVLYAYVRFPPPENPSWYILHRKPSRNFPNTLSFKLGKIDSLPRITRGSAVVTIGSNIYVIGGSIGGLTRTSDVTLIDCKSHTYGSVPRMRMARSRAAAGVIDGKIYVIGGCEIQSLDWVEVFHVKEQIWSRPRWPIQPNWFSQIVTYAVMKEKIYIMEDKFCYAYDPKETNWITYELNNSLNNSLLPLWDESSSCVIDDMLFCIDRLWPSCGDPIVIYDPKKQEWRQLLGLQGFPEPNMLEDPKMTNFGGNLVILSGAQSRFVSNCEYDGKKEICYVEISLERREDGEIWGKVESVAVVLTPLKSPSVELCPTVMV